MIEKIDHSLNKESKETELRVSFDQQVFLLQEYGGISRYICNLARELYLLPDVQTQVVAPLHFNRYLAGLEHLAGTRHLMPKMSTKLFPMVSLISKVLARHLIGRFDPDILHETYYSLEEYRPAGAKRVLTVYDLIHERYPDLFKRSHMTIVPKKASAHRADHIICISESTQRDLIEYCGVAAEKTSVVYLGVDASFLQASELPVESVASSRPFLLYVGARGGYKNFLKLLRAFASSARLKSEFDLVCFGGGPLHSDELKAASGLGLKPGQLTQLGGNDFMLAKLYSKAQALVYPSLYEGFGIPPLEAMAVGCPVICSNTSSLPEVVGDAAETFDPLDEEAMLVAMESVMYFPSRRNALIEAGRARHSMFSWKKCARETEAIYRKLL